MDKKLIEQLNKLREIQPEENFLLNSKREILAVNFDSEKKSVFVFKPLGVTLRNGVAILFVFVLVFVSVLHFLKPQELPIASAETLKSELESMPVNIVLQSINYSAQIDNTIDKTIMAITTNKAVHIDKVVLEQELSTINDATLQENNNIDELLEKIVD